MNSVEARAALENRVCHTEAAIDFAKPDFAWIRDETLSEFLDAWRRLAYYYEGSNDTEVSVTILDVYLRVSHILNQAVGLAEGPLLKDAEEALADLDWSLHKIVNEGLGKIYFSQDTETWG